MTVSHEFLSAGWRRTVTENMAKLLAGSPEEMAGVTFSVCEVFTNVPPRLEPSGQVIWHFRLVDGVADYRIDSTVTADDLMADFRIVMDAATAGPHSAMVIGDDPDQAARMGELAAEAVASGAFRVSATAPNPAFYERFHDMNAAVTTI
jgi:hypothetical protein